MPVSTEKVRLHFGRRRLKKATGRTSEEDVTAQWVISVLHPRYSHWFQQALVGRRR